MAQKTGLLLLNLGTPDKPETPEVRKYLRQFLSDPRVIDINAVGRWLLLNLLILPFRPAKSAEAYREIWTDEGSPLLLFTKALSDAVQQKLGDRLKVCYAMRYQNPSIGKAMRAFRDEGMERIIVFPLYPQYASSSTGSCLEEVYREAGSFWNVPNISVIPPYYDHAEFLKCLAQVTRETLGDVDRYDRFMFSFHGLPERQILKSEIAPGNHCLKDKTCCDRMVQANTYCYRAQSFATARGLAKELGLSDDRYEVGFQSRLGRTPWIQPYTDLRFSAMPGEGVKKLAVVVPSFSADCLETIEEIGIRGQELFQEAGGDQLDLVPCLNAHPAWVDCVTRMVENYLVS